MPVMNVRDHSWPAGIRIFCPISQSDYLQKVYESSLWACCEIKVNENRVSVVPSVCIVVPLLLSTAIPLAFNVQIFC